MAAVAALALAVLLTLSAGTAVADERPPTDHLVWAGLGMALPTYLIGVTLHEGSHAIAAKMVGAEVIGLKLLPGRHPVNKRFYFGYTQIRGRLTTGERVFFLAAPKITDVVFLGGYAVLIGLDAAPENRYGQLALAVLATGFLVDFAKDIIPLASHHDTARVYRYAGLESPWKQIPLRLVHAGLSAAAGYVIYRGYQGVFADADPAAAPALSMPLISGSF